jgi:hypothetical protein
MNVGLSVLCNKIGTNKLYAFGIRRMKVVSGHLCTSLIIRSYVVIWKEDDRKMSYMDMTS